MVLQLSISLSGEKPVSHLEGQCRCAADISAEYFGYRQTQDPEYTSIFFRIGEGFAVVKVSQASIGLGSFALGIDWKIHASII